MPAPLCPWSRFEVAHLITCEERLCSWVMQPMNTYSNIAYFAVAILLWRQANKGPVLRVFSVLAMVIGLSSALSHASQIRIFSFFDFNSIFVLFFFILGINSRRLGHGLGSVPKYVPAVLTSFFLAILAVQFADKSQGPRLFGLVAIAVVASEASCKKLPAPRRYLWLSLWIFALALFCFWIDADRLFCHPQNHWVQAHSWWHILTAISMYFGALYYQGALDRTIRS